MVYLFFVLGGKKKKKQVGDEMVLATGAKSGIKFQASSCKLGFQAFKLV